MSDISADIAIEPVFLVRATLAPDADELRRPHRARHLERIARLRDEGIILEAGALDDMSASVLLVRAPSAEAALDLVREDVYVAAGVWVEITVKGLNRVCRPGEVGPAAG